MPERTEITLRNRDLFGAQIGLSIISGAKRGKVDLFGTFKYHLSVIRGAVDRELENLATSRRELRDSHGKRDAKHQLVTMQTDERDPNSRQIVLVDPVLFETDERQILDGEVTLTLPVPRLRLDDVVALDFGEQQGDYSGALMFIEQPALDEPKETKKPAKARREA